MTLNEAVLNLWKFVNRFEYNHYASRSGLSNKYSQYPRSTPKTRKRKRHVNDGRGPDTTKRLKARNNGRGIEKSKQSLHDSMKKLFPGQSKSQNYSEMLRSKRQMAERKKKTNARRKKKLMEANERRRKKLRKIQPDDSRRQLKSQSHDYSGKFRGIQWNFNYGGTENYNTCPLDSFLVLLFILHKGKVMNRQLRELNNKSSLLARSFKEIDDNTPETGGINARMLFLSNFYKQGWLDAQGNNLSSSLDIFYHNNYDMVEAGISPIQDCDVGIHEGYAIMYEI